MDQLEFSENEEKEFKFQYSFSYLIAKKIIFLSTTNVALTIPSLFSYSPFLKVESKTNLGRIIIDNFYLSSFITPSSVNPVIDFRPDEMVIPKLNFINSLSAIEYVVESKIRFTCSSQSIRIIMLIVKTPGVI
jgi:hypothetical protein